MRTLCAALLFGGAVSAQAQVPGRLGYQGQLLKSDGTPETGVVTMSFAIFDTATAGSTLGCDLLQVALMDGHYSVLIGGIGGCTLGPPPIVPALFDGRELYLEVLVGGVPLAPRQRIGSVAYAIRAGTAVNVRGGTVEATSVSAGGTGGVTLSASGISVGTVNVVDSAGQITASSGVLTATAGDARYVLKAGDTVTGNLTVNGNHAVGGTVRVGASAPTSALAVDTGTGTLPVAHLEGDRHSAGDPNSYLFLRDKTGGLWWGIMRDLLSKFSK